MNAQTSLFPRERSAIKTLGDAGLTAEASRIIESFHTVSEAEGGIKRLRDLVLELAVRGVLVPQSFEEGTSEPLVRELMLAQKKMALSTRSREDLPPMKADERPFEIPASWSWVRFGQLGGFLGGGTPAKSNQAFWNGPIPWVSPKDMKRPYIDDAEDHISEAAVEGSAVKLIPSRSILFVVRGMILTHSFPVAVTTRTVTINQDMKALVLAIPEMAEYILRVCWAARRRVLTRVERSSHGTCRLDTEVVEELPIPLPPVTEQKRIVAKVDQLMALYDELEAKQAKKREVGNRLTKAALGALTSAEGPEEFQTAWKWVADNFKELIDRPEKVEEARKTILELAVRGWFVGVPNAHGEQEGAEGKPFSVPVGWRWVQLATLCERITKGSSPTWQGIRYVEGPQNGVLFVTSENVGRGRMRLEKPKYVESRFNEIEPRSVLRRGDLLMNIVGASIGRVAIFDRVCDANINQAVCLIRLTQVGEIIDSSFMLLFLNSPTCISYMFDKQVDNARANLSMGNIAKFAVPLPPLKEQRKIVSRVEHLMKLCDDLETKLRARDEKATKLAEALVAEIVG